MHLDCQKLWRFALHLLAAGDLRRDHIGKSIMTIEIKDVKDGLGNVILGSGIVKEEEYIDVMKKYLTQDEEKFKKYRYSLADWTAINEAKISSDAVQLIARLCKQAAKVNPNIIVGSVTDQNYIFGLARMAYIMRDDTDWENKAFRNRAEAEAWIKQRVKEKYSIDDLTFS